MDKRIGAKDFGAAMRAAKRLGSGRVAIVNGKRCKRLVVSTRRHMLHARWRDQGNPQQARELWAPVYGWCTEGFDTRDLEEANALLEELAA